MNMTEEVTAVADQSVNVTQDAPVEVTPEATPEQVEQLPEFSIPDEYSQKSYASKIKSQDDVWKQLDNMSSLIGKKAVVPNAESSDEEWSTLNSELGDNLDKLNAMRVPESYEYSEVELPEGIDTELFQASTDKFSEIAKGAGASNKVADAIRSEWVKHELQVQQDATAKGDAEFEALGKETWGGEYEAKVAELTPIFQKFMPENVRANMQNVPANQLIPLMLMADQISSAGKPDGLPNNPAGQGVSKEDAVARMSELRKLAQKNPAKHQQEFNDYQERTRSVRNS